jgi:tetratricopeptide (TPR) repeat protein
MGRHRTPRTSGFGRLIAGAVLVVRLAWDVHATPPPEAEVPDAAREAITACAEAETVPADERPALLEQAVALAEQALHDAPSSPSAQFALFCALGKRTADAGLSLRTLWAVPRLREASERALALAPGWSDAMAARGAFLFYLPRVFGGDPATGEGLLREALRRDPDNADAHAVLADVLLRQGHEPESRAEAERAHALFRAAGRMHEAARVLALAD